MIKQILSLTAIFLSFYLSAQTSFEKYYGGAASDYGFEIKQTSDGGYITAGPTTANGYDYYVVKTNSEGDTLWTRTFGGSDEDWAYSVEETNDGGYAIFGWTKSYGSTGPDFYLIKLDIDGNTLWTKLFEEGGSEYGYTMHETSDGGFALVGSQCSLGPCNFNVFFVKADSNGDTLWTRVYGGDQNESGMDFIQTLDGGYAIGGYTASFGAGSKDFYLVKTDSNGDTLWTKTYGGANDDEAESIRQTADGGYIMFGTTKSFGAGSSDYYLIKTDSNGDTLWTRTYGGTGSDKGFTVQQTNDGGYILMGQSQSYAPTVSAFYLIKTNSLGDTLWTKVFAAKEVAYGRYVEQTTDGGFVLCGTTFSMSNFNNDVAIIKLAPDSITCSETTSSIFETSCENYISPSGNYTWTSSNTYYDTIPNAAGCDSIITINLTIHNNTTSSFTASECYSFASPSGNYVWTTSGVFYDTIPNVNGCDSILTIDLSINNTSNTITEAACENYISPSGNYVWTNSGVYSDTIPNASGCDSIIIINLTIHYSTSDTIIANVCDSYISPSGDYIWTTSGFYQDTIPNSAGCDSVIAISLSVNEIDTSVNNSGNSLTANELGANYQWIDCGNMNSVISGETAQTFIPDIDGNYAVIIQLNNCSDTSACYFIPVVGISDVLLPEYKIYPNPAGKNIVVELEKHEVAYIELYNIDGKLLQKIKVKTSRNILDLNEVETGIYFIKVISPRWVDTKKIIKL